MTEAPAITAAQAGPRQQGAQDDAQANSQTVINIEWLSAACARVAAPKNTIITTSAVHKRPRLRVMDKRVAGLLPSALFIAYRLLDFRLL